MIIIELEERLIPQGYCLEVLLSKGIWGNVSVSRSWRPDVFMWLSRRFSKRLQWITRGESRRYHFQNTSNWNDFFMNMCRELNFFKNSNLLQGKSAVGYRQNIFNFCDCIAITFVIIFVAMWCVGIYHYYISIFLHYPVSIWNISYWLENLEYVAC